MLGLTDAGLTVGGDVRELEGRPARGPEYGARALTPDGGGGVIWGRRTRPLTRAEEQRRGQRSGGGVVTPIGSQSALLRSCPSWDDPSWKTG